MSTLQEVLERVIALDARRYEDIDSAHFDALVDLGEWAPDLLALLAKTDAPILGAQTPGPSPGARYPMRAQIITAVRRAFAGMSRPATLDDLCALPELQVIEVSRAQIGNAVMSLYRENYLARIDIPPEDRHSQARFAHLRNDGRKLPLGAKLFERRETRR